MSELAAARTDVGEPARVRVLESVWYGRSLVGALLAPLGWIYAALIRGRRLVYRLGLLSTEQVGAPVVVVGNITVGGTGKTPLVGWLALRLRERGMRPGIVCRGYGGSAREWPQQVDVDSDPALVGDEPVLLARRGECPVVAGPDRVGAARALVERCGCDVILSDDGLQHLRLARDVEVAVIDGERRHGNGRCLPAGPLREPVSRLASVDFVVTNGAPLPGEVGMRLCPSDAVAADESGRVEPLESFRDRTVHAVAGIGHPERFFRMLESHGIRPLRHPFPDHHPFEPGDLDVGDDEPVLMTEKDAVKCARFAGAQHWYVPVHAEIDASFADRLAQRARAAAPATSVAVAPA